MTWHLNGEPLPLDPGSGWPVIDGYQYPPSDPARLEAEGAVWIAPEPAALTAEDICRQIDAERDRRQTLDFEYDFGDIVALLDDGTQERAGIRNLQMETRNKTDWLGQHGRALAAMNRGEPNTTIFIRAEDNANLMVPAVMWIEAFEEGADRDERLMAFAGQLKTQVRTAEDPNGVDWLNGWPE